MFSSLFLHIFHYFKLSYFSIKKSIDNKLFAKIDNEKDLTKYGADAKRDFGKYESFINFMISTLFTPAFINLVKKYVDAHYKTFVDEKESEKYEPGSTFTNEQFKLFYVISILTKFAIPLATHYIYVNSDKNIEVFSFMYTVFDAIFRIVVVGTDCKSLMNKLYKYVDKIVRKTEPSNKLIWQNFPMYNDTRESVIDDFVVKIVTTIVPKFDLNQSIINLITVVSRESIIKYKIKANNPFDCYRINDNDSSNDDEDALSESDIFDMFYKSIDESILSDSKEITLHEIIPDKQNDITTLIALKDELEKLSALEKEVVKERYFNDYTQKKVADNLGMSQVQVSRQEQKVLEKLRKKLV